MVEVSTENESLKNEMGFCDEKWLEDTEAKHSKQFSNEKIANLTMSGMEKQMTKQN